MAYFRYNSKDKILEEENDLVITLKSPREIDAMHKAGDLLAEIHE